jgi:hypothetical protein
MGVFCVLSQDAFDLPGVIGCFVADDFHRNGCKITFDCGKCSAVTKAHASIASARTYGDDWCQDTEAFQHVSPTGRAYGD